ncbi:MAG: VOC family protein [Acidimicrobiia bacterium]|nr:VOC family protein [Acidimicrobiia bacterium]
MSLEWEQVIVASRDPMALGRWWCEALGWVVVDDGPEVFEIQQEVDAMPGLLFVPFEGAKVGQNRLHIDLRPDDQYAEVDRLVGLGASRIDVGQGDAAWIVLADPEGNEFCVLSARTTSTERARPG